MKYLILSRKGGGSVRASLSPERLEALLAAIETGKRKGTVDGVYGMTSGGVAAIVSADDPQVLNRELLKLGIAGAEVIPIRDASELIREHLEMLVPMMS